MEIDAYYAGRDVRLCIVKIIHKPWNMTNPVTPRYISSPHWVRNFVVPECVGAKVPKRTGAIELFDYVIDFGVVVESDNRSHPFAKSMP